MTPWGYIRDRWIGHQLTDAPQAEFAPEPASRYFRNTAPKASGQVVGDATADDLDFDSLFAKLDYTLSRVGQQVLYARMRLPEGEQQVGDFIRRTALFESDPALSTRCAAPLKTLCEEDAYDIQNLIFDTPQPVRHIRAIYLLTATTLLSLVAGVALHPLFLLLFGALFFVNTYLHYSNKLRITGYLSAVNQLRRCIRAAKTLAAEPQIKAHYNTSFLPGMETLRRRSRIIGIQGGSGSDFAAIFYLVLELLKIVTNAEIILFDHFIRTITHSRGEIDRMFRFVGEIDAARATAQLKAGCSTCRPQFLKEKRMELGGITHPLIDNCRTNSLTLNGESLLLTGSNMSGKTTFIRAVCINALLGQTLGICFAEHYAAPFMHIHTSVRICDDITQGASYYLSEVLTIKSFLDTSAGASLCLFALDELFKGTNTAERIAAGKAVLQSLNDAGHLVLVATHDAELTRLLQGRYALYHFREEIRDGALSFDYLLHAGPLTTRNAIRILELYGYPQEVVDDACQTRDALTIG